MHREYHNITSYFNGFFNANEKVKAANVKVREKWVEDYDSILPIFILGDTATLRAQYPDLEKAIEKCEKVISKHTITNDAKKDKKKPKLNKWIDDNYMVLGQAHFMKGNYFKAYDLFNYVNRKFTEKNEQIYSAAWIARCAIEREEYSRALQALSRIEPEPEMEDKYKAFYYEVFADLYIRQGKYKEAAEKLGKAIPFIKRKRERARPLFILAQLYQRMNESNKALENYNATLKSHPSFELEFYARINKALSFNRRGGTADGIRKELEKMLRDEKNKDYLDQIYFALGDLSLEQQKRAEAAAYYEKSIKASKPDNKKMRAKAFLKLADLYFDQRQYENAQLYYDSTLSKINEKHIRFKEVKARAESLGELIGYLNTIELNDSLNVICGLKGDTREKRLKEIIVQLQAQADEQRRRDEEAAQAAADAANNQAGADPAAPGGTFWAFNPAIREKGYNDFKDYWGDRPLKDNWRLAAKVSQLYDAQDESVLAADSATANNNAAKTNDDRYRVPDLEELKASLPCDDPSKMKESSSGIAEAYYQSGLIYKEKLDDDDNAIAVWQQLVQNMDTSSFHPVAYYQLFRTWLDKESSPGYSANPFCGECNSQYWGDIIKEKYPGTEWARLVDNPNYVDQAQMKSAEENAAYEATYAIYAGRRYQEAIAACNAAIDDPKGNSLQCKYRLLRAVCVGYTDAAYSIKENYFRELNEVKKNCPNSEEATRADEMIRAGNQESPTPSPGGEKPGGGTDTPANPEQNPTPPPVTPPAAEVTYKVDMAAEHYMAVLLPIQGTDINKEKIALADYNTQFYASSQLKVTNNLLGQQYHILLVKTFKTVPEAKDYLKAVSANKEELKGITSGTATIFLISKPNYISLFKSKDVDKYLQFYQANYQN